MIGRLVERRRDRQPQERRLADRPRERRPSGTVVLGRGRRAVDPPSAGVSSTIRSSTSPARRCRRSSASIRPNHANAAAAISGRDAEDLGDGRPGDRSVTAPARAARGRRQPLPLRLHLELERCGCAAGIVRGRRATLSRTRLAAPGGTPTAGGSNAPSTRFVGSTRSRRALVTLLPWFSTMNSKVARCRARWTGWSGTIRQSSNGWMPSVASATIASSWVEVGMIRTAITVGPAVVVGSSGGVISTSSTSCEPPNSVRLPRRTVVQLADRPAGTTEYDSVVSPRLCTVSGKRERCRPARRRLRRRRTRPGPTRRARYRFGTRRQRDRSPARAARR